MLRIAYSLAVLTALAAFPEPLRAVEDVREINARNGLPSTAAHVDKAGEFSVAYLGGSITAAEGWRDLTTAGLGKRLGKASIIEIPAGLPGTGSDVGVCRLEADVLRHRPNLLFVEFAVNDTGTPSPQVERTMEGIVRKTWRTSPETDICFVYTVSTPGLPDVTAGRHPLSAAAMEKVAAHYGVPSVQLGFDVARRVAAGEIKFKGTAEDGDHAFSLDGVHPTPAGHRLYARVIERALPALLKAGSSRTVLPAPLHADNWERAEQRNLSRGMFRGEWTPVELDDPNLRGATKKLLPPTWRTDQPGAAVEFEFTGTRLGLLGIAAPDSGEFIVIVDGGEPVADTFFDSFVSPTFCRARKWFYPQALPPGRHRVRVELSSRAVDKAAIKRTAGKELIDPALHRPQRLGLSALLLVDTAP